LWLVYQLYSAMQRDFFSFMVSRWARYHTFSCHCVPEHLSQGDSGQCWCSECAELCLHPSIYLHGMINKHREIFTYTFSFTFTCTLLHSSIVVGAYQHRYLPPTYKTTLCLKMEDHRMNLHHHENLKFYSIFHFLWITKKVIIENFSLLRCDAVLLGEWVLVLWRILYGSLDPSEW